MIRPGVTFVLWLAIAVMVVANDAIGDTWIAAALPARAVEWYKVLVPLPYVALISLIHARRTRGPQWLQAAAVAAINWPPSVMLVDYLYGHFTFGEDVVAFFQRFQLQYGQPYPLLLVALFAAPLLAGRYLRGGERIQP
jgi:hypothetical protein